MEEETALPVSELLELLSAVWQGSAALLDILFSATYPCALGTCKYICEEVVLLDDVLLGRCLAVVPWSGYGSCNVGISLLLIVDIALVDAHKVSKYIKMVCVVVAAIDVGHSVDDLSA